MVKKAEKVAEQAEVKEKAPEKPETAIAEAQGQGLAKDMMRAPDMMDKRESRNLSVNEIITLAGILWKSRLFKSLENAEQAVAQIMAGQELGLAPVYSLNHLYIIPNKPPAVDGQAMANMVRRAGYSYAAIAHKPGSLWTIGFYKGKDFLGEASFSIDEAAKVGLTQKGVWKQYADDMLFWRALSRGARRWCPDAISGAYLLEELDIEVDTISPAGMVITGEPDVKGSHPTPKALPPSTEQKPELPSRGQLVQDLVDVHSKAAVLKAKEELGIKESLKLCSDADFEKLTKKLRG